MKTESNLFALETTPTQFSCEHWWLRDSQLSLHPPAVDVSAFRSPRADSLFIVRRMCSSVSGVSYIGWLNHMLMQSPCEINQA